MVLSEQGSRQHMGQVFHGVPRQILPVGQNQCPAWKNFKFLAHKDAIHPRSLGKVARVHTRLSSSWDGLVARTQSFYNGLTMTSRAHLDAAAAGGAYLDLTIAKAKTLIEKMVAN